MSKIIEIKNLHKAFGDIKAVNDLSFCVKEGELFAFLGENGAGKSTTINIMCGELQKDSGSIFINGQDFDVDINNIKNSIGVVFQFSSLDKSLSVIDNLESRAALYGIFGKEFKQRVMELSEMLDFKDLLKRPLEKLSGGQKRRIDIARALIHKPKILILDEPTTGLDPQTRKLLWDVLDNLRKTDKMTVFLTTHYMEEAAEADYVVILDEGKIIAEGSPLELKNNYSSDYIYLYNIEEKLVEELNLQYEKVKDAFKINVSSTKEATDLIINHPNVFIDYEITKGKMDDVFLTVTGKKIGGDK